MNFRSFTANPRPWSFCEAVQALGMGWDRSQTQLWRMVTWAAGDRRTLLVEGQTLIPALPYALRGLHSPGWGTRSPREGGAEVTAASVRRAEAVTDAVGFCIV